MHKVIKISLKIWYHIESGNEVFDGIKIDRFSA